MFRKMIPGFCFNSYSKEYLLSKIDEYGGWPLGFQYIGFIHSSEREVGFCNSPDNDGYWTVVLEADDYYFWKLSSQAKQRIVNDVISSVTLPKLDYTLVKFRDSKNNLI